MLPKFYYINLQKCIDRETHMINFFKKIEYKTKLKCRYERIDALNANNVNINEYSNLTIDEMWNFRNSKNST